MDVRISQQHIEIGFQLPGIYRFKSIQICSFKSIHEWIQYIATYAREVYELIGFRARFQHNEGHIMFTFSFVQHPIISIVQIKSQMSFKSSSQTICTYVCIHNLSCGLSGRYVAFQQLQFLSIFCQLKVSLKWHCAISF